MLESCGTTKLGAPEVMVLSPSVINRQVQLRFCLFGFCRDFTFFIVWIENKSLYFTHNTLFRYLNLFDTGGFQCLSIEGTVRSKLVNSLQNTAIKTQCSVISFLFNFYFVYHGHE